MGQSQSQAPYSGPGDGAADAPPARPPPVRHSFAIGPRRGAGAGAAAAVDANPPARRGRRATTGGAAPSRRGLGSLLARRGGHPGAGPAPRGPDDGGGDGSSDSSDRSSAERDDVPQLPPPRRLKTQRLPPAPLDEPPSLVSMEDPDASSRLWGVDDTSSRQWGTDETSNLSSSDLMAAGSPVTAAAARSGSASTVVAPPLPLRRRDEPSHPAPALEGDGAAAAAAVGASASPGRTGEARAAAAPGSALRYVPRRASAESQASATTSLSEGTEDDDDDHQRHREDSDGHDSGTHPTAEFYPRPDRHWMGRSIETLLLGYAAPAPVLRLAEPGADMPLPPDADYYYFYEPDGADAAAAAAAHRRRSTASTFGGYSATSRRRSSQGSFPGGRRGSLSLSSGHGHGGTLAVYYRRRGQPTPHEVDRQGRRGSATHVRTFRRRSSVTTGGGSGGDDDDDDTGTGTATTGKNAGPNACLSIMARECTGRTFFPRDMAPTECLRLVGGYALFSRIDKPAAGIVSEVAFLAAAIDSGDWSEAQLLVSRLSPRLIGDPSGLTSGAMDPNLPPTAPRFYAGGGRVGLEREAFVLADGIGILARVLSEKSFVGQEMAASFDARDLSSEIVATRLAPCWNEALAILRELVFAIPSLVMVPPFDNGKFLPFLFTLLAHDSTFDAAAALIEEILAILSQSPQQPAPTEGNDASFQPMGRLAPPTTFFLGNVPKLYKLWKGFNCRQLAHFCRILALLVFEPEDRQLLESPAVLKSLELLRLRRSRALRAGRDATVDLNQSILLGDEELMGRLLKLLKVMNFAPSLHNIAPFHVMTQYPFIADTLVMLGLGEIDSWDEIDRQETLSRRLLDNDDDGEPKRALHELGSVTAMLESLGDTLGEPSNQIGSVIQVISAAQQAGVIVGRGPRRSNGARSSHSSASHSAEDEETAAAALRLGGMPVDAGTVQGLASVAGILSDQMLVRRLYISDEEPMARHFISTPEDAANSLQFNGIILGAYQVEILFVLCTLLGGRRKLDAQQDISQVIPILEDMFERLPFARQNNDRPPPHDVNPDGHGVHGPGCECTPESALCVQFLRLIHNFCDRDVDNYSGRRLLLSPSELDLIVNGPIHSDSTTTSPGLLSKIIGAFMRESDESPYRFWLASCIESFLRGSLPEEQAFVAKSGLMKHLLNEISSEKLHCAGSLQTSFDILGELTKGNSLVVKLLMNDLDEDMFRKVFSVATGNLIDSNVFIRSLLLTVERLTADRSGAWKPRNGATAYLTHSWMDVAALEGSQRNGPPRQSEEMIRSEWFPPVSVTYFPCATDDEIINISSNQQGWVFGPSECGSSSLPAPNTVQRLAWFLEKNKATLLRDLMEVVSLQNINHENICCLNTALVVVIFAHRRKQLHALLRALRNHEDDLTRQFSDMTITEHPRCDIMRNFREVLWFWSEYYTHRGRDRLSLEFSSHVRFQEWSHVVSLLTADDGSPTSLVHGPIRLPRSPYHRAARSVIADGSFLRVT